MATHFDPPDFQVPLTAGRLHYTRAGGGGPAILLIHGSLCDYRYWRWQIPAFSEHGQIIAPSLRGCWPAAGQHPQPGYAIAAHARDLAELLVQLDVPGGVHVVGHSRGAQVAVALVKQAPERCRSLTLADPGFRFDDEPETEPFYHHIVAQLQAGDTEQALQDFVDTANGEHTWRQMVAWFKEMVRDNAMTLLSQIREANLPVSPADVAAIRCPLLLVGGVHSPVRYGSRQDRIQRLVPQAQRVHIALAAHGMNLANPRAFNQALLTFVRNCHEPALRA